MNMLWAPSPTFWGRGGWSWGWGKCAFHAKRLLPAPPTPGPPCQGLFNCPRRSRSECLASTVHEVVSGCFSHPESFPLVLCFSNSVTSPPWCGLCHPPMTGTLLISWAPPVRLLWGPTRSSFLAFERALGVDADVLVLCE